MAADAKRPPATPQGKRLRAVHRELLQLALLIVVAVAGFLATRVVATGNDRMRVQDAAAWYERGRSHLTAGRTKDAITAFRRAASKAPDNRTYVLGLAAAYSADHQNEAAKQELFRLRDVAPEDVGVNVELARLEAQEGDFGEAVRYYQNALNAVWRPEQTETRRRLRTEVIRLLLAHDQRSHALSELLVASADLPDDAAPRTEAGRLFMDAGDPRRALDQFARALALEPQNPRALTGAGEAAFALGDYARARRYLATAPDDADRVADLRRVADLVLANDPLAPRLSLALRTRRVGNDLQQAIGRLDACLAAPSGDRGASHSDLEGLQRDAAEFESTLSPRASRESPDAIESGVELIYRLEKSTEQGCGAATPFDRALVLIGQLHGFGER